MKFIKELWNRIRGLDTKAAAAIKDDVNSAEIAIEDSRKQIADYESQVRNAIIQNKKLSREAEEAGHDKEKYLSAAKEAKANNDLDSARTLLEHKQAAEKKEVSLKASIAANDKHIANARSKIEEAKGRVSNAETNKDVLAVRKASAEIRTGLASGGTGLGGSGALAALDDLEDAVEEAEFEAEATEELSGNAAEDALKKYSNGGKKSIDDELANL